MGTNPSMYWCTLGEIPAIFWLEGSKMEVFRKLALFIIIDGHDNLTSCCVCV